MPTENTVAETEVVQDMPRELQVIVQQNSLQPATAQSLTASFEPLFAQARSVINKSRQIVVTDASQKLEMKLARECRIALKVIRVTSDKTRKELKDESLRTGRAIDSFHNILLHLTDTEEKRLQDQEDFVQRQEDNRKAALKSDREKVLIGIQVDPNLYQLGEMTEETFQRLIEGTTLARAAEAERKRKDEAERIEREAKEQAERERIRQENARLKKESEEKEAALKAERERVAAERKAADEAAAKERAALEAKHAEERRIAEEKAATERKAREASEKAATEKAKKEKDEHDRKVRELEAAAKKKADEERAAREELESKLAAQRAAEEKRKAAELEAARKAAAAPDRDKLIAYANAIRALEIPTLSTESAIAIASVVKASRDKFVAWIEEKSEAL